MSREPGRPRLPQPSLRIFVPKAIAIVTRHALSKEHDAAFTPKVRFGPLFQLEIDVDNVGHELDAEDHAHVVASPALVGAGDEFADVVAFSVDGADTAGDGDVDGGEGVDVFGESCVVSVRFQESVALFFEGESSLQTILG